MDELRLKHRRRCSLQNRLPLTPEPKRESDSEQVSGNNNAGDTKRERSPSEFTRDAARARIAVAHLSQSDEDEADKQKHDRERNERHGPFDRNSAFPTHLYHSWNVLAQRCSTDFHSCPPLKPALVAAIAR